MNAVIVDTEATSNDPKTSKVIELAAYTIGDSPFEFASQILPFLLAESAERYRKPIGALYGTTEPIKFGAMAAHNILPEEIEGKPEFGSYQAPLTDYLIGHNIDFDAELMKADPALRRICTLAMARALWPGVDAHNQSALIYYIGHIKGDLAGARARLANAHRAVDDVENCAILLQALIRYAIDQKMLVDDSWEAVWQLSEECRIPKIMTFGKHKGEPVHLVPWGYIKWYLGTADQDPFLLKAWRRAGLIK